jgi:hypothetical protein
MRIRILSTAVVLSATLAACGESGTGPSGAAGASAARHSVSAAGTGSFSTEFAQTVPCSPSGAVDLAGTLSGSWDEVAKTARLQIGAAVRHQACAIQGDRGVVTVTGDPDIDLAISASGDATGLTELRVTEVGAFNWQKGAENSGRCTVDLTAELVAGTRNVRVSGSFCGFAIDETTPIDG